MAPKDPLRSEIEAETHAARVRDYGAEDAATYEQRVKEGADTVRHLDPAPPDRDTWMAKLPIDEESRKELAAELEHIKRDSYIELEVQVAGWNYTRGEGGYLFHELPVKDREVLVEDYVDWDRFMARGLTYRDQGTIMHEAARDPFPRESAAEQKMASMLTGNALPPEFGLAMEMRETTAGTDYQKALDAAAHRGGNDNEQGRGR